MAANITYVSDSTYAFATSDTSIPITAFNVTTGNLLVVALFWSGGTSTDTATATVTDGESNTYTNIGYKSTGSGSDAQRVGFYYCINPTGNATLAITGTISAARTYRRGVAVQYSYDGTITFKDDDNGASATDVTAFTDDAAVSHGADDLIATAHGTFNDSITVTPTNGTNRAQQNQLSVLEYIPSSGTSYTVAGTQTSNTFVMISGVFGATSTTTTHTGGIDVTFTVSGTQGLRTQTLSPAAKFIFRKL